MKPLLMLALLALAAEMALAQPSATTGTGQLGITLSSYGRVRAGAYPYVSTDRELDRLSLVVAQSSSAVYDYTEDSDSTAEVARILTIAGVDSAMETLADNEYTMLPPKVKVRTAVLGWLNQNYFIVRFTVIADTAGLGTLRFGAIVVPRVGKIYGGETVKYNAANQTASFFRVGDSPMSYWGLRALGPQVTGVRSMDWDDYSADPDADAATDSMRYAMTAYTGFDAEVVAGSNGSVYSVNTGSKAFAAKGDSAVLYYAVAYGPTENDMNTAMTAAAAKYAMLVTSVRRTESPAPSAFSLGGNYPNPFNPSTKIPFSVAQGSDVRLSVHDALGRVVSVVVDRRMEPGQYVATFDASSLSAGIYYYTMTAGRFTETKKMLLVK